MDTETIAAIATPVGNGGIGIIKISGKDAISIAASLFRFSGNAQNQTQPFRLPLTPKSPSRKIYFGRIVHPVSNKIIDEVLLIIMPGPRSYTREDVVEIHTHGGFTVLNKTLALLQEQGARLAEPGEFTKRAFLNGRIDLTQAEAVMDIINATSDLALNMAANQVSGVLGNKIENIIEYGQDVLAKAEAVIDFPEDVGDVFDKETIGIAWGQNVLVPIENLIEQHERTQILRDGIKTVIIGRPNVGKSSLMNCLLQKERVIVSDIPGTTRDFIEESRLIRNLQIVFADTAGLHDSNDELERIGIQKTYDYINDADLVLFVIDLTAGINHGDLEIFKRIEHKKVLLVLNKGDLVEAHEAFELPAEMTPLRRVRISAKYSQGIESLEQNIIQLFVGESGTNAEVSAVSPNLRQFEALTRAAKAATAAIYAINDGLSPDLCVIDIKETIDALGEVLGRTISSDVLDKIFENFCIGK